MQQHLNVATTPAPVAFTDTPLTVSDADKYAAITGTLDRVWSALTDDGARDRLTPQQIPDWLDTVEWALRHMPECYESLRVELSQEVALYQLLSEAKGKQS